MRRAPVLAEQPVLVTGAAGFLGANLTRALARQGAGVHAVLRPGSDGSRVAGLAPNVRIHRVDLLDGPAVLSLFQEVRPFLVFHCAMQGGHPRQPEELLDFLRTSLLTTAHVLEASRTVGIHRVVHMGGGVEYGFSPRPIRERDPLRPRTGRGIAKAAASVVVGFYARSLQLPAVILRPFSVYGPWEPPARLIPTLLRAAIKGEAVALTAGTARHDFVFVEDVVEAALLAATRPLKPGTALNVGTGVQWTNEEVASLVEAVTGRPLRIEKGKHPGSPADTEFWAADMSKTRRLLRWSPRFDLRSGLEAMLRWMEGHGQLA